MCKKLIIFVRVEKIIKLQGNFFSVLYTIDQVKQAVYQAATFEGSQSGVLFLFTHSLPLTKRVREA